MPLDLKAKAERIAEDIIQNSESWWLGADEIVSLCKEVQDATRREGYEQGVRDSLELIPSWSTTGKIYDRIYALLTTPEKK